MRMPHRKHARAVSLRQKYCHPFTCYQHGAFFQYAGAVIVIAVIGWLLIATCMTSGCEKTPPAKEERRTPATQQAEQGPVSLKVQADRSQAGVAEGINLTITAQADNGVSVTLPKTGDKLGPFIVTNTKDLPDLPLPGQAKRQWQRRMKIESIESGKQVVPPVRVTYTDNRDPARPIHGELTTKPLELTVASVLEGRADPRKFRDVKGTVDLPAEPTYTWAWATAGGVAGGAVLAAGVFLLVRHRRQRALRADRWALGQLDKLNRDGLVAAGLIEQYYCRLTDVVRQYIERRFGIHAPNQTTREFLAQAAQAAAMRDEHKPLLDDFLAAADMVKFACFTPDESQMQNAMQTARTFVIQSAVSKSETKKVEVAA